MQKSLKVKALIFDMDGTMIDNMMVHHKAWQRKLASLGKQMTIEQVMQEIHGVNEEIISRLFGDRFNDEEIRQIAWDKEEEYRTIFADKIALIDGLERFLDQAVEAGIPMGIGTAAPPENVKFVLDALDLRKYFSAVVSSDMVTKGKPDPEVFVKVAQQLNIPITDCVIFEDSPTGAKAAENANSHAIVITTTHKVEEFSNITSVARFINDYTNSSISKAQENGYFEINL